MTHVNTNRKVKNVKNIDELREHALETLDLISNRFIDISEAAATAKIYESIISSIKTELEYCRMIETAPKIKFLNHYQTDSEISNKRKMISNITDATEE